MNTNQMIDKAVELQKKIFLNTATDAQRNESNAILASLRANGITMKLTTIVAGRSRLIEVVSDGRTIQYVEVDY